MVTLGSRTRRCESCKDAQDARLMLPRHTAGRPYTGKPIELTSRVGRKHSQNAYRLLLHENVESPLKIQRLTECLSQPTRCCQWFVSPEGRLKQAPGNSPPEKPGCLQKFISASLPRRTPQFGRC